MPRFGARSRYFAHRRHHAQPPVTAKEPRNRIARAPGNGARRRRSPTGTPHARRQGVPRVNAARPPLRSPETLGRETLFPGARGLGDNTRWW
jgi:hypothetical protein